MCCVALVCLFVLKGGVFSVILIDTVTEEDVNLNNELVHGRHASFDSKSFHAYRGSSSDESCVTNGHGE